MQQIASAVSVPVEESSRRQSGRRPPRKLHGYFVLFTLLFALIVVVGFSRTFFIPVALGTFSKPMVVHVHGAFFFTWTGLLVSQAMLAANRRLRTHRKVGSIAGWLIIPMLILGTIVAVRDTVNDFRAGDGEAALSFFYGELADLSMFGLLAGAAMLLRNRPEYHKRWVILGSLGLIGAAIGRIPEISAFALYIFLAFIASVAAYDLASRRSLHPATIVGAAVLLLLGLLEDAIGNTKTWIATAHRLLHV
ncbi:MAG: hypothetical protein ACTHJK_06790 [Sphingomicrobium sp.]